MSTKIKRHIKNFILNRLSTYNDKNDLIALCKQYEKNKLIDIPTLKMIEGVISVAEKQVRDTMVPRTQMVCVHYQQQIQDILPTIIASKHSRFPVMGENDDEVIGILLAKDLLNFLYDNKKEFSITQLMHAPFFVPESKRLSKLLESFQMNHTHLAIVVDEYGGIAGLVTIEDAIEQIVGDIEDEHYVESEAEFIKKLKSDQYIVQALTPLSILNQELDLSLNCNTFDTLGGYIAQQFGYLPKVGEHIILSNYQFTILHADQRRIRLFEVEFVGTK
jgi:magnesium and cobalt transporter